MCKGDADGQGDVGDRKSCPQRVDCFGEKPAYLNQPNNPDPNNG